MTHLMITMTERDPITGLWKSPKPVEMPEYVKNLKKDEYQYPYLHPQLRLELRELINDILDERELQKKLDGPYDFQEDVLDGLC